MTAQASTSERGHPYAELPMVVLVGRGRSGTTALRHALTVHPRIDSTGNENNIIEDMFLTVRRSLNREDRRLNLRVPVPVLLERARQFLLHVLWPEPRECADAPAAIMACADMRIEHLHLMFEHWPGCRVLYLVRNGIEVVSSRLRFPGFRDLPFERHCDDWASTMDVDLWGRGNPRFHLVRHERLIDRDRAEAALGDIFDFLELETHPACAADLAVNLHHPTGESAAGQTPGDLLKRRADRWRQWTDDQRDYFQRTCAEAMAHFGYQLPWLADPSSRTVGPHSAVPCAGR